MINRSILLTSLGLVAGIVLVSYRSLGGLTDYGATAPLAKPNADANTANQKLDYHTDLFTGSLQYQIPIKVPPARQGTQPGLALTYSSSQGNGWCGVGWDLGVGYIQRETRDGVPVSGSTYGDSFGFAFSLYGQGGRLRSVSGTYYPEINRSFLKFAFASGSWMATDKSGNKYYFGSTTASRIQTSFGTFRWALDKIVDVNGNKTEFVYQTIGSERQLYLQRIDYNANEKIPAIAATCSVEFGLQTRTDVISSCIAGAEIQTAWRLSSVTVKSGANTVRTYSLAYTASPTTYRSLLQSVTETGNDGTSLPAQSFTYQVQSTQFSSLQNWTLVSVSGGSYYYSIATPATSIVDINGDGKPDRVVKQNGSANLMFSVQKGTGSSFQGSFDDWYPLYNEYGHVSDDWNSLDTQYSVFTDINRDRLPDRVMRKQITPFDRFYVQLNSGTGFGSLEQWTGITYPSGSGQLGTEAQVCSPSGTTDDGVNTVSLLTDMNGDGFPDHVMSSNSDGEFKIELNRNGYFAGPYTWNGVAEAESQVVADSDAPRSKDNQGEFATLIDMNGDGLPDRVYRGAVISKFSLTMASMALGLHLPVGAFPAILIQLNSA